MGHYNQALNKKAISPVFPTYLNEANLNETAFALNKDYKFRKASLLDIPFVFEHVQDGSQRGSFTLKFMTSKGWVKLLNMLILDVLAPHRFFAKGGYDIKLLIFTLNKEDVGFMRIKYALTDKEVYEIDLCAIDQERRNQKIGSQMIRRFVEDLPSGAEISAYCTIYSRAMQHILKKMKFKRDKKHSLNHADHYRFTKPMHME